jgi:hypothetical protein
MWSALWQWRKRGYDSEALCSWLDNSVQQVSSEIALIAQHLLLSPLQPPPPRDAPLVVQMPLELLLRIATTQVESRKKERVL